MSGPIRIDPGAIASIANNCQRTSSDLMSLASTMQGQMNQLREALQGIPRLAMADRFDEWNQMFTKLSDSLSESNAYLNKVVQQVDEFVASLG